MEWSEAVGILAIYDKNREMLSILQLLMLSTANDTLYVLERSA